MPWIKVDNKIVWDGSEDLLIESVMKLNEEIDNQLDWHEKTAKRKQTHRAEYHLQWADSYTKEIAELIGHWK